MSFPQGISLYLFLFHFAVKPFYEIFHNVFSVCFIENFVAVCWVQLKTYIFVTRFQKIIVNGGNALTVCAYGVVLAGYEQNGELFVE